jgi:hypothetical protein
VRVGVRVGKLDRPANGGCSVTTLLVPRLVAALRQGETRELQCARVYSVVISFWHDIAVGRGCRRPALDPNLPEMPRHLDQS